MKLCKNCNWHKSHDYSGTGYTYYDECLCPDFERKINSINGEYFSNSCFTMRNKENKCGKEGKHWMEKQSPETKEGFWSRMFNFG